MYEMKDNSFSIFTNGKKAKDTDCDFNGTLKLNGVEYWINGWSKDKNGLIMSGTVKAKNFSSPAQNKPAKNDDDFDQDIPWA